MVGLRSCACPAGKRSCTSSVWMSDELAAMRSRINQLSDVPVTIGLSTGRKNPVKPELFAGRHEARLANSVDITQFGVNHVTPEPGAMSALRHWHAAEDEFVYVLSGRVVLIDDDGEHVMAAGTFAGFPAGCCNAHHLQNKSDSPATFLVIGSRKPGQETIHYPDDDIGPVRT